VEDRKILKLLWERAERALELMAKKYGKRLMAIAMNIIGIHQDAEEAVSDTYLAVWNAVPPKKPDPMAGYVYRTGRNISLDRVKYLTAEKRDSRYDLSIDELANSLPSAALEDTVEARELGRLINKFLSMQNEDDRALFLRRYWFGDEVKAIAKDLEIRSNTASVRLSRLRNQLRELLMKEGTWMNEKVAKALGYVEDGYVSRAAKRKRVRRRFTAAIAALLALVIFWETPSIPLFISAKAVSIAPESRTGERPGHGTEEFEQWYDARKYRSNILKDYVGPIRGFSQEASQYVLSGTDMVNRVWSPVNAYISLAMTAELTGGNTQADILEVLRAKNAASLRSGISAIWESLYEDNGKEICVLANSLWLDDEFDYHQQAMDDLAYHYYASVYQGDLGSDRTNRAITNWLNNQTGGLLKDRTDKVALDPAVSCLALASTIYFQSQWNDKFDSKKNTQDVFHTVEGDIECTYMNMDLYEMNYYWGEDFGAVQMWLENGSNMWFILPDEDKTVDDVLSSGEYGAMLARDPYFTEGNKKWMKVNLSVPKFDVSATADLKSALSEMGLEQLFQPYGNDFSPSIESELPIFLDEIHQDTRVTIDEEGVTAASYILLEFGAGAAAPPDEIIDFVMDRPFIFAVTKEQIPLFIGTVNNPI